METEDDLSILRKVLSVHAVIASKLLNENDRQRKRIELLENWKRSMLSQPFNEDDLK